jgi:chromosome segregation ATPase
MSPIEVITSVISILSIIVAGYSAWVQRRTGRDQEAYNNNSTEINRQDAAANLAYGASTIIGPLTDELRKVKDQQVLDQGEREKSVKELEEVKERLKKVELEKKEQGTQIDVLNARLAHDDAARELLEHRIGELETKLAEALEVARKLSEQIRELGQEPRAQVE